jgi:hypothetical protein
MWHTIPQENKMALALIPALAICSFLSGFQHLWWAFMILLFMIMMAFATGGIRIEIRPIGRKRWTHCKK